MPVVAVAGRLASGVQALDMPKVGYRADIDGLRAVAVLPVVLFHAKLGPFGGGFIGVDIFFVISGFLITQLIVREAELGQFSFMRFYERRIRRLFPALFVMLCAAVICAALLFLPADFRNFGRHVVGATLFVSNLFFWADTDYFDAPAETKPLLHTWSLAVEEQYYIFFPLLLVWLLSRGRPRAILAIGVVALLSFIAGCLVIALEPAAAFFLTPFRIWELLLGSLLALGGVPPLRTAMQREVAASLGMLAIVAAVVSYSQSTPFPGFAALLPCAGTALIIHAGSGEGRSAVGRILMSRPAVFVGAISYSLYLWHWPLIVFGRYYLIHELSTAESLALVAASFALAILSWRFIERPFRAKSGISRRPLFIIAGTATGCALATGTLVYAKGGLPQRFPAQVGALSSYAMSYNPEMDQCGDVDRQLQPQSPCTIGEPAEATLMLWGDSHAGALFGAFDAIAQDGGPSTIYGATARCPPQIGLGTSIGGCMRANDRKLDYVLSHPEIEHVVLAARWSFYVSGRAVEQGPAENNANLPRLRTRDGQRLEQFTPAARTHFRAALLRLVDQLLGAGKQVILVYPIPETGYDIPSTLARMRSKGEDPASLTVSQEAYRKRQRFALAMLDSLGQRPGLQRIYPEEILCRAQRCLTSLDTKPLYFDSHHLSVPGAKLLLPQLRSKLGIEARS